jgi:glycosyltransferase involved in cell wall biosynthesis
VSTILILSLNYSPEATGFAPHSTALAEHLVKVGHDVTVVTGFPFAPVWKRFPDYRGEIVRRESMNGVDVVRVSHFIPRRPGSAVQRILMEGTFAAAAGLALLVDSVIRGRFDVVIYAGAQPALAWLARGLASLCAAPYIVKITDLAAQAAADVAIVSGPAARLLNRIEFGAYRRARAAIVLCDSFKTALKDAGFQANVHLIRDSVDLSNIRPGCDGAPFRRRHGIADDEFVVLYSGSLGLKQGLAHVVRAASLLDGGNARVRWVIVGEGETKASLRREIDEAGVGDRVLLLGLQPEAELSGMLAAADALLLSQLQSVKDTVIPSKLLMYMAAGRPVVAAVSAQSQAAAIVRDAAGGIMVAPEDAAALAHAVAALQRSPDQLAAMGHRNRCYAERHFDRNAILEAQQRVIETAMEPRLVKSRAAQPQQQRSEV